MGHFLILSVLILIIDRVSKVLIFSSIPLGESVPVFTGILHITPTYNSGVAFGLLRGYNLYILMAIAVVTIAFILYIIFVKKPGSNIFITGLFLVLAGAIGNLIDRLIYKRVLDFIDLRVWPVFNIADTSITIGACLLLVSMFLYKDTGVSSSRRGE